MKRMLWSCLAVFLLTAPIAAFAADGYVTGNVNLRAGPDGQYPALTVIPAGTAVSIQGCTQDWEWCDVIAYNDRGWVAGNFIQYDYDNQAVLLPAYGARIGIPIVSFVISSYWGNYYRNRPFYRERARWYSRPIPRRPPPRPMNRPLRPIHNAPPQQRRNSGARPPANRPTQQRPADNRGQPARSPTYQRPQSAGARPANRGTQAPHSRSQPAAHGHPAKAESKKKKNDHDGGGG